MLSSNNGQLERQHADSKNTYDGKRGETFRKGTH